MHLIDQALYDVYGIPLHMRDGLNFWFDHHREPGGFLQAVLQNDLVRAVMCGDAINRSCLHSYVLFLTNEAPDASYGSHQKYLDWIDPVK